MTEPVALVASRPEAEVAAELKQRMLEALQPVLELMKEANRQGLAIQWDSLAPAPPTFQMQVNGLKIVRVY